MQTMVTIKLRDTVSLLTCEVGWVCCIAAVSVSWARLILGVKASNT